jgi:hypothetical protein
MKNRTRSTLGVLCLAILALPGAVGCQTDLTEFLQALQSIEININGAVNQLQTRDPRDPDFMVPGGKNLMITEGVDLITDPSDQLDPEGFDDVLLIGFENTSGNDMYIEYTVDDEFQSIFVFDGETVLLEYPCASSLEVTLEEDYDPLTFTLVNMLDWTGTMFASPDDFDCASALIITMDGASVNAEPELIDLNNMLPPGMGPGMGPDMGSGMEPGEGGDEVDMF